MRFLRSCLPLRAWLTLLPFLAMTSLPCFAQISLVVENAILVTMDDASPEPFLGWFSVDASGRINEIAAGHPPDSLHPTNRLDASGKIIIPGMVSAHSHLWSAPFRGIAADQNLLGWLAAAHAPFSEHYQKGDFAAYTRYGALDFLSHGITTCYNWVWNDGFPQAYFLEQFEAQRSLEQRFVFGWALDARLDEATNHRNLSQFLAYARPLVGQGSLLDVSLSALGLLRGPEPFPQWEGRWLKEFNLDAQSHYLEDPSIQVQQRAQWNILKDAGLVGTNMMFAHFIHPDDRILRDTAAAGARMVWNPLSNGRLASGLADIPAYRKLGIPVGMGLDGQASSDLSDPFENMRMGLYATRMKHQSATAMSTHDILAQHTIRSAEVMKVADRVGSLTKGKFADFLVLNPLAPDIGPLFDVIASVVMCCSSRNLTAVYVGGNGVYRDGSFVHHDFPAIRRDVHQRVDRMRTAVEKQKLPVNIWHKHMANLPRCLGCLPESSTPKK